MIVHTDDGLFESRRGKGGWSPRVRLPREVNANGTEIGALFSSSECRQWSLMVRMLHSDLIDERNEEEAPATDPPEERRESIRSSPFATSERKPELADFDGSVSPNDVSSSDRLRQ